MKNSGNRDIGARMNFCFVHRVVLSKRDCLFVSVIFCILLVIDNEEREVWNANWKKHHCTLHGELKFYPRLSVLVKI